MSLELKVNTSQKISIDLLKNRVISNLNEAKGTGRIRVDEKEFVTICNLIQLSFDQASQSVFKNSEELINQLKNEYGNSFLDMLQKAFDQSCKIVQ